MRELFTEFSPAVPVIAKSRPGGRIYPEFHPAAYWKFPAIQCVGTNALQLVNKGNLLSRGLIVGSCWNRRSRTVWSMTPDADRNAGELHVWRITILCVDFYSLCVCMRNR